MIIFILMLVCITIGFLEIMYSIKTLYKKEQNNE